MKMIWRASLCSIDTEWTSREFWARTREEVNHGLRRSIRSSTRCHTTIYPPQTSQCAQPSRHIAIDMYKIFIGNQLSYRMCQRCPLLYAPQTPVCFPFALKHACPDAFELLLGLSNRAQTRKKRHLPSRSPSTLRNRLLRTLLNLLRLLSRNLGQLLQLLRSHLPYISKQQYK